ncbi:hypothetical protein ITJ55_02315 [Frigoribacterium sp. VKM Ac-1396]|uniref:hypothetical protein n=1 Tax=Frigoribacterium sp. VKM Ac-1396 TaxID=2783821 RepID=UPI00188BB5E4|nr:hypothetical protein [Frigoribacterium sp. VKM Ac-1396]MBF4599637.1 hypothetical protein [Frigoribacterium sp. VKM Ac-1396]
MTDESTGPYRVLSRRLDGDVERLRAEAPDGRRVVLRRRGSRPTVTPPVAEAVAFAHADHPHVARLVDVFTGPTGELVLAFDDVGGDPLASWLAARGRPETGEVVTLVVPVLGAVQHLARRGVALSALGVDDVEIDGRGAPVIVGLSGASAAGPDAEAASLPVAAEFARSMVGRATRPGGGGAAPALDPMTFESLVESVFDLGEAVPLSSVDAPHGDLPAGHHDETVPPDEPAAPAWWALLPESEVIDRVVAWLPGLRAQDVVAGLRRVRPRYRALGAGAVLVGAAALVLGTTATGGTDRGAGASGDAVAAATSGEVVATAVPATPDDRSVTDEPVVTDSPTEGASTAAPTVPGRPRTTGEPNEMAVLGDDAGAAAAVLLRARLDCLREATPSCLAAVDQAGSPIALRDATVLDDPSLAADRTISVELTGESSATGGAVLLAARGPDGEPASVLVMRTEAGWRLRDVFVDG